MYTFKEQIQGFPWSQVLVLALVRFAEPLAFASLLPYIYFMVKSFGIPEADIPRCAGYMSGCFAMAQVFTGIFWGTMSDRIGRKPVLIIGIVGSALSLTLFGLSKDLVTGIITRCIAGLLNGNVGVLRTVLGEVATERRHQALAFSVMPLLWQAGTVIGPMVGGYLADPVTNHPEWFEPPYAKDAETLFTRYRYLLPNLAVSALLLFGATMCILFVDETHPDRRYKPDYGRMVGRKITAVLRRILGLKKGVETGYKQIEEEEECYGQAQPDHVQGHARRQSQAPLLAGAQAPSYNTALEPEPTHEDMSWSSMLNPAVRATIMANTLMSMHGVVFDLLMPVFLSARVEPGSSVPFNLQGGLGFASSEIGEILSSTGILGIFMILLVFPWMDRRFGTLFPFKLSTAMFPFVYLVVPYLVLVGSWDHAYSSWIVSLCLFARTIANSLGPPAVLVLVNRAASNGRHLGAINGLVQVCSALGRTLGPFIFGYLMAKGLEWKYVQVPWWTLTALAAFAYVSCSPNMPDKQD